MHRLAPMPVRIGLVPLIAALALLVSTLGSGVLLSPPTSAASQNEIVINVVSDGTSRFDSGEPRSPTGVQPEPHTAGKDGGSRNGVVRTHDLYTVRVDWNVNEEDATNVALTVELPDHSEWTAGSDGLFPGCDPATTILIDPQTLVCGLVDQHQGSNGSHRLTARLNSALDNDTFTVEATLTTDDDANGVSDTLDEPLTVSEAPRVDFRKHDPEISEIVNDGTEAGRILLFPISIVDLSQAANPAKGAGPIDDDAVMTFYDHIWSITPNATLASPAQFDLSGFAGTNCGVYTGTGPYTAGPETWACGAVSTPFAAPDDYDVVPITVSNHDSINHPTTLADGTTNGPTSPMIAAGQIAIWVPESELQDAIADATNDSTTTARFFNSITADDTTVITAGGDIVEPAVTGTSISTNFGPGTNNTGEITVSNLPIVDDGGDTGADGAGITHDVNWYPGPFQLFQKDYSGEPRQHFDMRFESEGGLFVLNEDFLYQAHSFRFAPAIDIIGETPRGAILTIDTDVTTGGPGNSSVDAPLHGCVAFDTAHYALTSFDQIPVNDISNAAASTILAGSNAGPLAHALVGHVESYDEDGSGGFDDSAMTATPVVPYVVEFTDAPLQFHSGTSFGVADDELTCNDSDAGASGWVASTDVAGLADFDADGDGAYEGITRARYRTLVPIEWGEREGLDDANFTGMRVYFQAQVAGDLNVNVEDSELMVLMGHSFGELVGGVPNMELTAGAGPAPDCTPTEPADWVLTGNDLATGTSWCNNSYADDGVDSFDVSDNVDWDNDSATEYRFTSLTSRTSGAMVRIVAAELALDKVNVAGPFDVKDIGDLVQFSLSPGVIGSDQEALTNAVLTDPLPSYYEFVRFVQEPTTPGATCDHASGTITCVYSEPDPTVDTGPLPAALPGGWPTAADGSAEVVVEVRVVGTIAASNTLNAELSNRAFFNSDGIVPWNPTTGATAGTVNTAPRFVESSAFSYLPLASDEGAIIKTVDTLEGPCTYFPRPGPAPTDWADRCSFVPLDGDMSFVLSLTNEGNTRITDIEIVDVFPHNADELIESSTGTSESATDLLNGSPQTHGDGRTPPSDYNGTLAFVSLTGVNNATNLTTWVTADDPTTISRDPDVTVGQAVNTWCDAIGGTVQSGPGTTCPAAATDVTATYSLLPDRLPPGETIDLRLTLDSEGARCSDIWTNTFGARFDEVLLPIRSNDVSIMVDCEYDLALDKKLSPTWTAPDDWITPGSSTVDFVIEVTNQGDSVEDVDITDYVDTSIWSFDVANNPDLATGGSVNLPYTWDVTDPTKPVASVDGPLPEGASFTIPVTLTVQGGGQLANYAEISAFDNDGDPSNGDSTTGLPDVDSTPDATSGGTDGEDLAVNMVDDDVTGDATAGGDEDDHDVAFVPTYDLALIKTRSPGQTASIDPANPVVSFDITVKNQGPTTAYLIDVVEYAPAGTSITGFAPDSGALVTSSGTGFYQISQLAPGEQVTFSVELTIGDLTIGSYLNAAEVSGFDVDDDPNNAVSPLAVDLDSTPDAINDDDVIVDPADPSVADDPDAFDNSHNEIDYDPDGDGNVNEPTPGDEDDHDQELVFVPASVGDLVWSDTNGDGIQDPDEPGIEGITVELYDAGGNLVTTTTTDASGNYEFTDLPPGTYTVTFVPPPGSTLSPTGTGNDGNDSNGLTTTIELDPGEVNSTIDLGIVDQAAPISGSVTIEGTGTPIGGVTIELYDADGNLVATTTTDADGTYQFPSVPPGQYRVVELQPNGLGTSTPNEIAVDHGSTPTTEVDFVETAGVITGTVTLDDTNAPIEGVTVTLTGVDVNGNEISLTTRTDADGRYRFDDLVAGEYVVTELQPPNYVNGRVRPTNVQVVVLGAGETRSGIDFTEAEQDIVNLAFTGVTTGYTVVAALTLVVTGLLMLGIRRRRGPGFSLGA